MYIHSGMLEQSREKQNVSWLTSSLLIPNTLFVGKLHHHQETLVVANIVILQSTFSGTGC